MQDQTEAPAATEGQDGSREEVSEPSHGEALDAAFDSTETGKESQEQKVSEIPAFDWSQYQNAEHLKGRGVQEVINYYNQFQHQYGQQANELGTLRQRVGELARQAEEYRKLQEQISGQQQKEAKKFSEGEQYQFTQDFYKDPLTALQKHLTPTMAEVIMEQLVPKVAEKLMPQWQEQMQNVATGQERNAFYAKYGEEINEDPRLFDTMRDVMTQYLGDQVPYEQAFLLAKLIRDEGHLFDHTCALMRQGVPFNNARDYAEGFYLKAQNAKTKKENIKSEIGKLKYTRSSAKKEVDKDTHVKDFDDAFDNA